MSLDDVVAALKSGQITQAKLASESGIGQPTISNIVTGRYTDTKHTIATALIAAAERLLPAPEDKQARKPAAKGVAK